MTSCLFCDVPAEKRQKILYRDNLSYVFEDEFPVNKGHLLIIPNKHYSDWFETPIDLQIHLMKIVNKMQKRLDVEHAPDGYNIGMNCGVAGGQSIFHLHIHLIPRYHGDCSEPRGGIRGIIPGKQDY